MLCTPTKIVWLLTLSCLNDRILCRCIKLLSHLLFGFTLPFKLKAFFILVACFKNNESGTVLPSFTLHLYQDINSSSNRSYTVVLTSLELLHLVLNCRAIFGAFCWIRRIVATCTLNFFATDVTDDVCKSRRTSKRCWKVRKCLFLIVISISRTNQCLIEEKCKLKSASLMNDTFDDEPDLFQLKSNSDFLAILGSNSFLLNGVVLGLHTHWLALAVTPLLKPNSVPSSNRHFPWNHDRPQPRWVRYFRYFFLAPCHSSSLAHCLLPLAFTWTFPYLASLSCKLSDFDFNTLRPAHKFPRFHARKHSKVWLKADHKSYGSVCRGTWFWKEQDYEATWIYCALLACRRAYDRVLSNPYQPKHSNPMAGVVWIRFPYW